MNKKKKREKFNNLAMEKTQHQSVAPPPPARTTPAPASSLTEAWGTFLRERPWDLIAHLTFPDRVHPEQAARRFSRWITQLDRNPIRGVRSPIIWVRGTEYQQRGVVHYHALLAGTGSLPPFVAIRLWARVAGGTARILPYDPRLGGAYYITKRGDVDVSPTWFRDA